jgi:tape measure domain-containing protein
MTALGDATAAMGTGGEGIGRAVYALQQMNLVGAVKGQDMMQLANAGIPAWDALAAAAGKSVQQVKKEVENGTLQNSVPLLMQGIENYAGPAMSRMKGMMDEQSKTLTGLLSTLKDNVDIALGEMMKPATEAIKMALPDINDAVGETFKAMTKPINEMVVVAMDAFKKLMPAIGPIMQALSTVMVSAVQAIVPAFAQMAMVLPSLQPALLALGQVFTDLSVILAPLVVELTVGLVPILMGLVQVVSMATGFVADHVGVLEAWSPLIGGIVAGYVALKAVGKINMLLGSAKSVWGLVASVIGLGTAQTAEAAAASAAMVAQAKLTVAQASAAVAAGGGAAATAALVAAETALTAANTATTASTWSLNAALYANPLTWVIVAVVALVAAFVILWKKFEGFQLFWKKTWNLIVDFAEKAINGLLKYYQGLINIFIRGVNILIKAWNKLPFGDDIQEIKMLNFQLDLSAAKVDTTTRAAKKLTEQLAAAKREVSAADFRKFEGYNAGTPKKVKTEAETAAAAAAAGKANDKMKQLIAAAKQLGTDALQNANRFFDEYKQKANEFRKSIKDAIMGVYSFSKALEKSLESQNAYTSAQKAVADAEKAVADAMQSRDYKAYTKAVQDYADASEALGKAEEGKMSFMKALEKQYNDAVAFSKLIDDLRAAQLNEAGIAQIVAAGAEAGTAIGQEIIAGGADAVTNANKWFTQLTSTADTAATAAKDQFYQTGLDTGAELVRGIQEAVKSLNLKLTSKGLTAKQIDKLKKNFGVDIEFSMSALAGMVPQLANGGIVRARSGGTLALLGEAGRDEAVIPLGRGGNATSGNNYNITIQTGVGDSAEIGRELIRHLQSYEKRAGKLPIRTM